MGKMLKAALKKPLTTEPDEPEDRFAAVFHSFKDLHNVSSNQFLAKLERKGVVVAWKAKRRRATDVGHVQVSGGKQ